LSARHQARPLSLAATPSTTERYAAAACCLPHNRLSPVIHQHSDHYHSRLGQPESARRNNGLSSLATLSDQKTAKVIQLLEESRRCNPFIRDRVDREAEAMAHTRVTRRRTIAIEFAICSWYRRKRFY
jgi:hypothetical protein